MRAIITPTPHEKAEWSRLAQAAYNADRNDLGHRFSGSAALRNGESMDALYFGVNQSIYRAWLIDGWAGVDRVVVS